MVSDYTSNFSQLEYTNTQLRRLMDTNDSQAQRHQQQIIDLQAENSRLHSLIKNRESISLSMTKDSSFFYEDDQLANLEKDKLSKKVARLQKRIDDDQKYFAEKRKEFLDRER